MTSKPNYHLQHRVKVPESTDGTTTIKSNSIKKQLRFDPISDSFVLSVKKCNSKTNDSNSQSSSKNTSNAICQENLISSSSKVNMAKNQVNLTAKVNSEEVPKPKIKKKIIRPESFDLEDLLGPALFSQPHVMGKIKSVKHNNTVSKDPSKETINKRHNFTIKAKSKMDDKQKLQEDIKSHNTTSEIGNVISQSNVKAVSSVKTESLNLKKMPSKDISTPISKSSVEENRSISNSKFTRLVPLQPIDISELQPMKIKTNKMKMTASAVISPPKDYCKLDTSVEVEKKSRHNIQKRKRTYKEDSDFEEPSTSIKKIKTKPEFQEVPQRAQRQRSTSGMKSIINIENEKEEEVKKELDEISDSSSDDDSDYEGENNDKVEEEVVQESDDDDPDKLWCICRKPHNNKFMISCDKCQDWFHGSCIGITRKMGSLLEAQNKEWLCPNCKKGIIPEWRKQSSVKAKKNTANDKNKTKAKSDKSQSSSKRKRKESAKTSELESDTTISEDEDEDNRSNTKLHLLKKIDKRREVTLIKRDPNMKKLTEQDSLRKVSSKKKKETSPDKLNTDIALKPSTSKEIFTETKSKITSNNEDVTTTCKTTNMMSSRSVERLQKNRDTTLDEPQARISHLKTSKSQKKNKRKKSVKDSPTIMRNCIVCSGPVIYAPPQSIYCGHGCLEKRMKKTLDILFKANTTLKKSENWENEKVVVYDHETGAVVDNDSAPCLGNILKWLKDNSSYEIVSPPVLIKSKEAPESELSEDSDSSSSEESS